MSRAKKAVLVLATFTSITDTKKKALALEHILCIYYPIQFKKDKSETQIQALINSKSEINAIYPTFVKKLGIPIRLIDAGA